MSYNKKTIMKIQERLLVLSEAITKGEKGIHREFSMNIPARPLEDADLVLSTAATIILEKTQLCDNLENGLKEKTDEIDRIGVKAVKLAHKIMELEKELVRVKDERENYFLALDNANEENSELSAALERMKGEK